MEGDMEKKIFVGVSACLLGEPTRYDGVEKRHPALVDWLTGRAETVPLCPEVGARLPVPRPPMVVANGRLVRRDDPSIDLTDPLCDWSDRNEGLIVSCHGLVVKARSPSCALVDAPQADGGRSGPGVWVDRVRRRFPDLPLIDEGMWENGEARADWWGRVTKRFDALAGKG